MTHCPLPYHPTKLCVVCLSPFTIVIHYSKTAFPAIILQETMWIYKTKNTRETKITFFFWAGYRNCIDHHIVLFLWKNILREETDGQNFERFLLLLLFISFFFSFCLFCVFDATLCGNKVDAIDFQVRQIYYIYGIPYYFSYILEYNIYLRFANTIISPHRRIYSLCIIGRTRHLYLLCIWRRSSSCFFISF